jgi:methionyl-tRNA formyltransferase
VILSLDPLRIACAAGALELRLVRAPGRKTVRGAEFAHGARLAVGERLGGA